MRLPVQRLRGDLDDRLAGGLTLPKIRGVRPEFWTDEDIVDLSIPARLLFIGLWNYACDNGHLDDKPKQIKMRLLPGDDVSVAELLRELHASGRIERADGYITVPNLAKHQKPDRRWWITCHKPGCTKPETDSQPEPRSGHSEATTRPHRGHGGASQRPRDELSCIDGDGDGELIGGATASTTRPRKRAHQLPDDFTPSDAHAKLAADLGVNLDRECAKFRDHHLARGSTMKDWDAALRTWLRKAADYAPNGQVVPLPNSQPAPDPNAWMRRRLTPPGQTPAYRGEPVNIDE
jgi:hypothetical protein